MNGIISALLWLLAGLACWTLASGQADANSLAEQQQQPGNLPYYMQSPLEPQQQADFEPRLSQRASIPTMISNGLAQPPPPQPQPQSLQPQQLQQPTLLQQQQPPPPPPALQSVGGQRPTMGQGPVGPSPPEAKQRPRDKQCLYERRHFAKLDQCLARRPHQSIGLPAFKNDDLLVGSKGSAHKQGCQFTLSNGLFKNHQVANYALDSDLQCLDSSGQLGMTLEFSNATLYYLWQLRCLNYADQLLDDSTLGGRLGATLEQEPSAGGPAKQRRLCAGSSQTFGFTALQLGPIEAQLELAGDIYKNWRVTNVTLAFARSANSKDGSEEQQQQQQQQPPPASLIKDFTFEALDGDELNWRYLQTFSNWSRNRMHINFLDQFRRFVWISLQRCLSESGEKLPVKLTDLFASHKYN